MLGDFWKHWRFFVPRMGGFGFVLGGLFGGLTYPILGAVFGAPYGLVVGLVLGIFLGIGVPVYNRYFAPGDMENYQTRLTYGAAAAITAVSALPLLFIYALVAGLATAYITHQYAENPAQLHEKRKHTVDASQRRDKVASRASAIMMGKAKYLIGIAVTVALLGYTAITAFDPFTTFQWAEFIFIGIGGAIYGSIVAALIASVNAYFIKMVNRVFFDTALSKEQYKMRLVPLVSVLTLFLSMIVTAGIGAPFAAIVGGLGASEFANWYYEHEGDEKAKRGDASRLVAQELDELDEFMSEDDEAYYQDVMR